MTLFRFKRRSTYSIGSGDGFGSDAQPTSQTHPLSLSQVKTETRPLRLHILQKKVGVVRHD